MPVTSNLYVVGFTAGDNLEVSGTTVSLKNDISVNSITSSHITGSTITVGNITVTGTISAATISGNFVNTISSSDANLIFNAYTGSVTASLSQNPTFNSVTGTYITSSDILTTTLTASNIIATSDVIIQGNLTVSGTTTSINTDELYVKDATIIIASGNLSLSTLNNAGIQYGQQPEDISLKYKYSDNTLSSSVGFTAPVLSSNIITGSTVTGSDAKFTTITASFSGNGSSITSITSSNITNFTTDVRGKLSAGTGISYDTGTGIISASNIPNASLQNSSITISGVVVSLGGTTSDIATTGSNIFTGNQTITGSVSSTIGFTGSLSGTATGAINAQTASYIATGSAIATFQQDVRQQISAGSNLTYSTGSGQITINSDVSLTSVTASAGFSGSGVNVTNITASNITNFTADVRSNLSGGTGIFYNSGTGIISASNVPNSSLQNSSITISGVVISLGGSTSDIATTGSNTFVGNQIITGSVVSTVGFTGSLSGTATDAINAQTASYVATGSAIATFQQDVRQQISVGSNLTYSTGSGQITLNSDVTLSSVTASVGFSGDGFNITNITASNITNFISDVRKEISSGIGISYSSGSGIISNSGVLRIASSDANLSFNSATGNVTASLAQNPTFNNLTASNLRSLGGVIVNDYVQLLPVANINIPTNTTASYIYTSGSTNDLYFTQYQGAFTNTTRLRWLEGTLYTGLLHGGILSTVTGTTSFNVTSGSGLIVSYNASTSSDPYPTINFVNFAGAVSQSLQFSSSAEITYVSINANGEVAQSTSPPTYTQYKDRIFLGRILHQSGSVTNGAVNTPPTAYGNTSNLADFARIIGPLKANGHFLAASGSTTLSLTKTAGDSYVEGRSYAATPNEPNIILAADDPAVTVSKIYREHISGSTAIIDTGIANAGYTALDPTQYQNGNVLAAVGVNQFTVQRIFWFPRAVNRALFAYYGQALYNNFDDAIGGISTENFTEGQNTVGSAILVAYVVLKGNAANFTDPTTTRIVQAGTFRGAGGGGGGAVGGGATNLASLTDVSIGTPSTGQALVYNGTSWTNGTPANATSASFATNATSASFATTSLTSSFLNTLNQDLVLSGNLTVTSIVSGTINGIGSGLTNITASGIQNFTNDVRAQFIAGTDISIVSGTISFIGTGSVVSTITSSNSNLTFSPISGSVTGSLSNNLSVVTVTASSGFSGNLDGTASNATNAVTAQTASYIATGSAIATFQTDVRNQLSAGSNLAYSSGSGQFSLSNNPSVISVTASSGFSGDLVGTATNATSAVTAQTASYIASASAIATFQTDVRNQLSAGSNLTYGSGQFALSDNPSVTSITASNAYFSNNITIAGTASIGFLQTIGQSTLAVGDKYIVILSGGVDHTSLDGSGIQWGSGSTGPTVDDLGSNAHIRFASSNDSLVVFPRMSGSFTGSFNGNATTATNAITAQTASYIATGSAIATFQTDVRAQFTAGTNISIVNGQISSTGGASAGVTEDFVVSSVTGLAVGNAVSIGTGTNAPLLLASKTTDAASNAVGFISAISGSTVTVKFGGRTTTSTDLTGKTVGTVMYVGSSGGIVEYSSLSAGDYATAVGYVTLAGSANTGSIFIQCRPWGLVG